MKRTGRLPFRSRKQQALYRQRGPFVAAMLTERPWCEVPNCTRPSEDVHEPLTRARGGSVLDPDNARCICRTHHREIHDTEPAWAYELGFLRHSWDKRGGAA
jgi:hypothetical protein